MAPVNQDVQEHAKAVVLEIVTIPARVVVSTLAVEVVAQEVAKHPAVKHVHLDAVMDAQTPVR